MCYYLPWNTMWLSNKNNIFLGFSVQTLSHLTKERIYFYLVLTQKQMNLWMFDCLNADKRESGKKGGLQQVPCRKSEQHNFNLCFPEFCLLEDTLPI